ncbi:class I SAM-dependent methyltransferase [Undibacterium rugosum]|uniref:Class I SAM-dependent methyltransferase n=1 Tax=Undibacterium rugosum TaxID=2762291 RepID=A0A923I922_9BURK|nr:class I SAM-dependent methyltransferase [Undibacterium rugosum]MBC3934875.1 class I SAM-dependent methyltransferase [Undibacterium rugosum]MBR7778264.1 class I SAM-dependent methyltransferase [Undibacterium rugosum]
MLKFRFFSDLLKLTPDRQRVIPVALTALLIQMSGVVLVLLAANLFHRTFNVTFFPVYVVIALSCVAALIARFLRLDWWWCVIEAVFPWLVWFAATLQLNPQIYLFLFLFLFALCGATLFSRVPYYPSPDRAVEMLAQQLSPERPLSVLDVGSGFGGVLFGLSEKFPRFRYAGIELALFPFLVSWCRAKLRGESNVSIHFGNYEDMDLAAFDVVYAYLSPVVMSGLWEKVQREMLPGTIFISYEFVVHGRKPDFAIQCGYEEIYLYGWKM